MHSVILIIARDTCANNIRLHELVLLIEQRGGGKLNIFLQGDEIVIIVNDVR